MDTLKRRTGIALALTAALVAIPAGIQAQECAAEVDPAVIPVGETAVAVTVALSESVGAVTGLEGGASGIATAAPADIPRTAMAADEQPRPIQMGEQQNTWTVWLSTAAAEPGRYMVAFVAGEANCVAAVTVGPQG